MGPHGCLRAHSAPSSAIANAHSAIRDSSLQPSSLVPVNNCSVPSCSLPFVSPVAVNNCSTICHAFLSRTVHCDRERKRDKGKNRGTGDLTTNSKETFRAAFGLLTNDQRMELMNMLASVVYGGEITVEVIGPLF